MTRPMTNAEIAKVRKAADRVRQAEEALARERAAFRATLAEVHENGVTLTRIGKELGVTRQRVYALLRG